MSPGEYERAQQAGIDCLLLIAAEQAGAGPRPTLPLPRAVAALAAGDQLAQLEAEAGST